MFEKRQIAYIISREFNKIMVFKAEQIIAKMIYWIKLQKPKQIFRLYISSFLSLDDTLVTPKLLCKNSQNINKCATRNIPALKSRNLLLNLCDGCLNENLLFDRQQRGSIWP